MVDVELLPASSYYEKTDLNSTDCHSFIHPFGKALDPLFESKTDWQVFAALARKIAELARKRGLAPYRDQLISDLSTGTRRLVELAVMVALRPRVLLLDEPSAGISAAETDNLVPLLLATKERLGCSVMLIEHDIALMRRVADRIAALDAGEVNAVGPADEVLLHPRVIESYLGATTH